LEKDYAQCDIIKSDPVVTYKETITAKSSQQCLVKSQNKHNRIFANSENMVEGLQEAIEKGEITPEDDVKGRAKRLVEEFEWEKDDALKIWGFGTDNTGPNLLVDMSKAVQYMSEIKDSMVTAFQGATKNGILTDENMRGFRVNVVDCELHADAIHRGGGQILPAARRLFYACELTSQPTLYEPIFMCEITAPMESMGGVYQCLNQRRGQVLDSEQITGTPLNLVTILIKLRSKLTCQSPSRSVSPVPSEVPPRQGLPTVRLPSLGAHQGYASRCRIQGRNFGQGHQKEKGTQGGYPSPCRLSRQDVINVHIKPFGYIFFRDFWARAH
jgi:translation elongation factor EF-G